MPDIQQPYTLFRSTFPIFFLRFCCIFQFQSNCLRHNSINSSLIKTRSWTNINERALFTKIHTVGQFLLHEIDFFQLLHNYSPEIQESTNGVKFTCNNSRFINKDCVPKNCGHEFQSDKATNSNNQVTSVRTSDFAAAVYTISIEYAPKVGFFPIISLNSKR